MNEMVLERAMMKILKVCLLVCALSLTACNAIHGLGTDLEKASDWGREKMPK